jgi:hypothetical protein
LKDSKFAYDIFVSCKSFGSSGCLKTSKSSIKIKIGKRKREKFKHDATENRGERKEKN